MLMNLRNALMAGKRLPYDNEIEFLESTGTQWIDTGILANGEFDVKYTIKTPATFAQQFIVGGARSATQHLNLGQYAPNGRFTLGYLENYWTVQTRVIASDTLYTVEIHYASGSQTAKLNEQNTVSQTYSGTEALNLNIYIFKCNYYGASDTVPPMVGRLYSFQIWQNGVLVRDYIPVRRGTVGYLYDRVSRKLFGNAGTGDFVLGPDVVPVEYIESHGTEYIVTPKILNSNTEEGAYIEMDVRPQAQAQAQYGVIYSQGSSLFNSPFSILANRGASTITALFTGMREVAVSTTGDRIKVRVEHKTSNSWVIFADGTKVGSSNMSGSYAFGDASFGAFNAGASKAASGTRFYSVSSSAYNLRPVRVGTEGAMMDTLTRRIYRNQGTGAFTYGNDLKYPIPA